MLGDHGAARTLYRRGLAIDPSDPLLRHNQAVSARLLAGGGAVSDLRYAFDRLLLPSGSAAAGWSAPASADRVRQVRRRTKPRVARNRADEAPIDLLRHSEVPSDEAAIPPTSAVDEADRGVFALRFGLFGSLNGAWEGRAMLRDVAGDLLGEIDLVIRRSVRQIRFRPAYLLRSEAIDTRTAAVVLCDSLRSRDVACRVIDLGEQQALSERPQG